MFKAGELIFWPAWLKETTTKKKGNWFRTAAKGAKNRSRCGHVCYVSPGWVAGGGAAAAGAVLAEVGSASATSRAQQLPAAGKSDIQDMQHSHSTRICCASVCLLSVCVLCVCVQLVCYVCSLFLCVALMSIWHGTQNDKNNLNKQETLERMWCDLQRHPGFVIW